MTVNQSDYAPVLKPENIPITLYIHLPWCLKKCPYCDFNSFDQLTVSKDSYLSKIMTQAKNLRQALQGRSLSSIFIGGGTPNLFTIQQLDRLLKNILTNYTVKKDIEITIETNPGINNNDFQRYADIGINRISLGVQSFKNAYLKSLNRLYHEKKLFETIDNIQKSKIKNTNIDLMFGLPNQTVEDGLSDLKTAINCGITHLSWYELTIAPHTPFAKQNIAFPNEIIIETMQKKGCAFLKRNGWQHYEISAFSLPSYQCEHNLNYWQFGDYIGIGAGAHSKITQFHDQKIIRIGNHSSVHRYCQTPVDKQQSLNSKEATLDFMINALRLYQPILFKHYITRTGNSCKTIKTFIENAANQKFIISNKDSITTTALGKNFMNQLLLELAVTFE